MKKPASQKDEFGCGIACLSFVLNIGYKESLKLFPNGKKKSEKNGFYCKEIVSVLRKNGLDSKFNCLKPKLLKKIYKENTIVFIRRSKKYPQGHYLCRYKNLWMDPWINFLKNKDVNKARPGFRKKLPGKPIYAIFSA